MTELPDGWAMKTVGSVTEPVAKDDPRKRPDDSFTYIDIQSIDSARNLVASPKVIAGADAPSRARQVVQAGDTVYSTVRPYLRKVALIQSVTGPTLASTGFTVLRPSNEMDPRFLFYSMLSEEVVNRLSGEMRGSSYPAVVDGQVRSVEIPVPPIVEQEQIVAAIEEQFERIEVGLASLSESDRGTDLLRQTILHAALSGAGYDRVAQISDVTRRIQYGFTAKAEWNGGGPKFVRITDMSSGRIDWESVPTCSAGSEEAQKFRVCDGDILVARTGSVGLSTLIEDPPKAVFASYLIRLQPNELVLPRFLAYCTQAPDYWRQITEASRGIGRLNVNAKMLGAITIPLPSLAQQQQIVAAIEDKFDRIAEATSACFAAQRRASQLRSGILASAFSGTLSE